MQELGRTLVKAAFMDFSHRFFLATLVFIAPNYLQVSFLLYNYSISRAARAPVGTRCFVVDALAFPFIPNETSRLIDCMLLIKGFGDHLSFGLF